ncbi:CsiV family protein [uncultured Oceanicoccus sp.]|uniref:CsiV family protein n=1 Tax=uncultured Oceanicoccus sp. TaxID=1706381 RepID=UPI0030DAC75D
MKSLVVTLISTILIANGAVLAQSANQEVAEQQWYQIEVLIFAYQDTADNTAELWPKELGLKYPDRIVELKKASQNEVLLNNWPDNAEIIESEPSASTAEILPEEIAEPIFLAEPSLAAPSLPEASLPEASLLERSLLEPSLSEPPLPELSLPEPLLVTLKEQPFTLLPQEEQSFSTIKQQLFRQKDLRQLFHGAWRQPIGKRNDSESLLIRGGDQFDNHFELEGSISFGLERYLHITTNLWLSTFVSNAGRMENPWPVLPKAPIVSSANDPETAINGPAQDVFNQTSSNTGSNMIMASNHVMKNPFLDLTHSQYAVDQTSTMRQSRRMRSNELHYIDHPLMGLLVRITPYEFPEPAQEPTQDVAIDAEINQAQPAPQSVMP